MSIRSSDGATGKLNECLMIPSSPNAITLLAQMRTNGLLMEDEVSQLSEKTRAAIEFLVSRIS